MRIAIAGGTGVVGRYAVAAAQAAGHEVTALSRAGGIDVRGGEGLDAALAGVEVVVDTLNVATSKRSVAEAFFTETSGRLQEAGAKAGVRHLVTLSILGIDRASGYGYYAGKLAQERVVAAGPMPATVLRAAQFHEFPAQLLAMLRKGPLAPVPRMRSQPVAARTVGERLVQLAEQQPGGTVELAGPEVWEMPELARRLLAARGVRAVVLPVPVPGAASKAMREGALLATDSTEIDGPTFGEWLRIADARVVPI